MAWPDFTYDAFEDFEDSSLATGFSETDTDGVLDFPNSAQHAEESYSARFNNDGSSHDARIEYAISSHNNFSCGFWYRTGSGLAAWTGAIQIFQAGNAGYSGAGLIRIYDRYNDARQLMVLFWGASTTESTMTPSDNTWYWITVQYNRNATSYVRIYSAAGNLLLNVSGSISDYACTFSYFGASGIYSVPTYIDAIVINHTDAAFPLLGWEESSGGHPAASRFRGINRNNNVRYA